MIIKEAKLKAIWDKYVEGKVVSYWDWMVLWFNSMGWFGLGYALVAFIFGLKWTNNGGEFNAFIFGIALVLFIERNIEFFTNLWTRQFHKYFPKGIVLPLIDRTIK